TGPGHCRVKAAHCPNVPVRQDGGAGAPAGSALPPPDRSPGARSIARGIDCIDTLGEWGLRGTPGDARRGVVGERRALSSREEWRSTRTGLGPGVSHGAGFVVWGSATTTM